MREYYEESLRHAESYVRYHAAHRVKNAESPKKGLLPVGNMLFEDGLDTCAAEYSAALYALPESVYYKDEKMLDNILDICPTVEKGLINEDGTTNQMTSNFHCPAMFVVGRLAETTLEVADAFTGTEKEKAAYAALKHLVSRYAEGCLNSGFHTPNHRWVETASLLMCYKLLGDERLKAKADKYIAEGIDIDEYGEYSERSAGMYNEIVDTALLMAYHTGYMPEALDAVHKNLDLMEYYVDDGDDIFSQNSRRTDKGERGTVAGFYKGAQYHFSKFFFNLAETAYLTGDLHLYKMAQRSFKRSTEKGLGRPVYIFPFLRHPELKDWDPDTSGIELMGDFEHYQPKSNIVRKRTGDFVCSVLANNPSFMFIRGGNLDVDFRICASFFALGQFVPKTMEKTENGYRMRYHAEADYKLPFDVPPENSRDYWSMDYKLRGSIAKQRLDYTVDFVFVEGGVDMHITTENCEEVPFKLEIGINGDKLLEIGDAATLITKEGEYVFARRGFRVTDLGTAASVSIEGMGCRHIYADNMRGGEPAQTDRQTVYFTDYTPVDKTVRIRYGYVGERVNYYAE